MKGQDKKMVFKIIVVILLIGIGCDTTNAVNELREIKKYLRDISCQI